MSRDANDRAEKRTYRGIWIGLVSLASLLLLAWAFLEAVHKEPEYKGKPLRFWRAALYDPGPPLPFWIFVQRSGPAVRPWTPPRLPVRPRTPDYGEILHALFSMPEAAAPLLARDLAYRESVYAKWFPWLATRLPIGLVQHLPQPANAMMIRTRADNVLSQMGTNAAPALPQLLRAASHSDRNAEIRALELIAQLGDLARGATPQLQTLLASANPDVRTAAAAALAKIPSAASSSIPALLEAWRAGRLPVLQTLAALTELGYSAPETIPDLISLLESATFKKMTSGSATNAAGSPVETIDSARTKACEYLGRFGPAATPAVPALSHMLGHSDSRVRAKAAWALGQIGPAAAPSAAALATAVGDYWWYVRENAVRALGEIGPGAAQAAAALESVRGDANADVRAAVAKSLQRITNTAPASTP